MKREQTIAIVGAGITGLTAAYYLQRFIEQEKLPYKLKLIEANDRIGGKIHTNEHAGFIIERGADSFLARKQPAVQLAETLGIDNQLVRNNTGQAYILVNDRLHKMPKGSFMGIPFDLEQFFESDIISEKGKERVKQELELPPSQHQGDQSLGGFLRYRFGNELVENVIEPLLSGVYSSDMDEMSLQATFPNFLELEQQYGSIIKGLQQTIGDQRQQTGKTVGQFYSFSNGLGTLINKIENELVEKVDIIYDEVTNISKIKEAYEIEMNVQPSLRADIVLMTTPHQVLSKVFAENEIFHPLEDIPSRSVANVALAFNQSAIDDSLDGTGFVVSRNSSHRITACTWTHKKWEGTTPEGKALLRAYVGQPDDQAVVDLSDEEIINIVLNDLEKTMKLTEAPLFTVVTRWKNVMPQYSVGHQERIEEVRMQAKKELPGMFFAGSSFEGVGIPDCIEQADNMVRSVIHYLQKEAK